MNKQTKDLAVAKAKLLDAYRDLEEAGGDLTMAYLALGGADILFSKLSKDDFITYCQDLELRPYDNNTWDDAFCEFSQHIDLFERLHDVVWCIDSLRSLDG